MLLFNDIISHSMSTALFADLREIAVKSKLIELILFCQLIVECRKNDFTRVLNTTLFCEKN